MYLIIALVVGIPTLVLIGFAVFVYRECHENPWFQDPKEEEKWRKENPHKAETW